MSEACSIFVQNLLLLGYAPPKTRQLRAAKDKKAKAARQVERKRDVSATAGAYAVSTAIDLVVGEASWLRPIDDRPAIGFQPSVPFGENMFKQRNDIGLFDILHYILTTCLERKANEKYTRELE